MTCRLNVNSKKKDVSIKIESISDVSSYDQFRKVIDDYRLLSIGDDKLVDQFDVLIGAYEKLLNEFQKWEHNSHCITKSNTVIQEGLTIFIQTLKILRSYPSQRNKYLIETIKQIESDPTCNLLVHQTIIRSYQTYQGKYLLSTDVVIEYQMEIVRYKELHNIYSQKLQKLLNQ
jgi:hypothetical protein